MPKAIDLSKLLPLRFRWRGEIAAAVYGELDDDEMRALETFLSQHPRARADFEELKAAHHRIGIDVPHLGIDLAPILRTRLAEESMRVHSGGTARRRVAFFAAASIAAAGTFFMMIWQSSQSLQEAQPAGNRITVAQSPMDTMLREAEQFIADRKYDDAYRVLDKAVTQFPDDLKAGETQLKLADIALYNLQWYEKARADYKHLMDKYWKSVLDTSEPLRIKENREMLEEASKIQFASLRDLEQASRAGGESYARLQNVAANYPETIVAAKATKAMAEVVQRELPGGSSIVQATETARNRCSNAVVAVQLDFDLACLYRDKTADTSRAREQFEKVRLSNQPVLAKRAEEALATLGN
jgi:outer membrane protein assembly factor BamD (BamD/ComL family)